MTRIRIEAYPVFNRKVLMLNSNPARARGIVGVRWVNRQHWRCLCTEINRSVCHPINAGGRSRGDAKKGRLIDAVVVASFVNCHIVFVDRSVETIVQFPVGNQGGVRRRCSYKDH